MASRDWEKVFSAYLVRKERDGEYRAYCPAHEEPKGGASETPSASFNFERGVFHCFSRCGGMSISSLYSAVKDDLVTDEEEDAPAPSSRRKRKGNVRSINDAKSKRGKEKPLPTEEQVTKWHERLMGLSLALKPLLEKRGLTTATLARRQIGWDGDRYMIPIRDADGVLVNVRRYKMGAVKDKMLNWGGHGSAHLFLSSNLAKDTILVCEGEMDALIAEQYGFASVSATAGAGTWFEEWTSAFLNKHVFIAYDNDPAGEAGARKVALQLRKVAEVHVMRLPVAAKQDLTDFFVNQGLGSSDLKSLMEQTPVYGERRVSRQNRDKKATLVGLESSLDSENAGKLLEVTAMVGGRVQVPYLLPRKLTILCEPGSWGVKCRKCTNEDAGGSMPMEVDADDPLLLTLIDAPQAQRDTLLRKEKGVQGNCPYAEMDVEQYHSVEELVLMPDADDPGSDNNVQQSRRAYNVGPHNTPVNTTIKFRGASVPDPRSSRSVFQSWESEPTKTSLDRFEVTPAVQKRLRVFQVKEGQTPMQKLKAIARDLEANVTKIYGRTAMHIAYDLVWHSLLDFQFRGGNIGKGWLELLVMGDTRTGKSEAAMRLTEHYRAGVLKSCEGATLAGLVGGAQQVGNSWVVTWGTIPLQDRRLVILDEVSGIKDKGVMEQMSAVRSSGRAQITKVVSQETNARTRLIWISNPADGRPISAMSWGAIDAIEGLVANPEDIARFDFAMAAASDDVDSRLINASEHPAVKHRFNQRRCSDLVMWSWSRKPDQVIWEPGAEELVMRLAEELGDRYTEEPPLIQAANARVKVARIAVAIAARLFSSPDGEQLLVTQEHARTAVQVLDMLYGMSTFGYRERSREEISNRKQAEGNKRKVRRWLIQHEQVLKALMAVMRDSQFRTRDFEEFGALGRDESQDAIGELLRLRMVSRRSRGYIRLEPELIDVLRKLRREVE